MAGKKKKKAEPKKNKQQTRAKIKRVEEIKNPKLPKESKIPKGVTRTVISDKGNIIMAITESDISGKKQTKRAASKKSPAPKKTTVPKSAAATKNPTVRKKTTPPRVQAIKHDSKFENGSDENIILVNKKSKTAQSKRGRRQLKRIANIGGYTAWDGRTGKTFASEKEAKAYALDYFKRTGEIIPVTHTQRTISHTFKTENETEK